MACDGSLDIRTIVPAGGDPHAFEPSLQDREVLDGATLVVTNGLGLEETLDDTLDAVEDGGVPVFAVGDHVDTLREEHDGATTTTVTTTTTTTRTSGSTRPASPPPCRRSARRSWPPAPTGRPRRRA